MAPAASRRRRSKRSVGRRRREHQVEPLRLLRRLQPAFAKAWNAAGSTLQQEGTVFLSVNDRDKETLVPVARRFAELGLRLVATKGTAEALAAAGLADGRRLLLVVSDHNFNADTQITQFLAFAL